MDTKILLPNNETYKEAREIIRSGGIVAFPTETVYGLGADAENSEAIKKIFIAKGRPQDNPLIVHISKKEDFFKVGKNITNICKALMDFMPGPITLIVDKNENISKEATAGLDTVGIRIPENKIARDFIEATGKFIAAPSANTSSRPSPTTAKHVYEDMNGKIPLIIDGGSCDIGIESTVVDTRGDKARIHRPGRITFEMIEEKLGKGNVEIAKLGEKAISPGMKYKHYAPKCAMELHFRKETALDACNRLKNEGRRPILIALDKYIEFDPHIAMGKNSVDYANRLFDSLRDAEKQSDYIIAIAPDDDEVGRSVLNRIEKSCGGNIVKW